ncbi:MAG TPA: hypothetical protein G4O10_00455 [Dehalococcoidia bacterium]|nr:hypothetical protein [Dehalococcoidia bacterium]
MTKIIHIKSNNIELEGILNDTDTAQAIWDILPVETEVKMWGDEIYFRIPLDLPLEQGQEIVELGDLGYWPIGSAFCIFFGPTPMSHGDEIRPASAVTVFGKVVGDAAVLKGISADSMISVTQKT